MAPRFRTSWSMLDGPAARGGNTRWYWSAVPDSISMRSVVVQRRRPSGEAAEAEADDRTRSCGYSRLSGSSGRTRYESVSLPRSRGTQSPSSCSMDRYTRTGMTAARVYEASPFAVRRVTGGSSVRTENPSVARETAPDATKRDKKAGDTKCHASPEASAPVSQSTRAANGPTSAVHSGRPEEPRPRRTRIGSDGSDDAWTRPRVIMNADGGGVDGGGSAACPWWPAAAALGSGVPPTGGAPT